MCGTQVLVQNPFTKQWEIQRPNSPPITPKSYHPSSKNVTITNHMGYQWASAADVLKTLLQNRAMRRQLLKFKSSSCLHEWRTAQINHPFLTLPLYLNYHDNDEDFCRKIEHRISLEQVAKWAQ